MDEVGAEGGARGVGDGLWGLEMGCGVFALLWALRLLLVWALL